MKLITAVIKPFKVDELRQAVADIGIQGVTVTEVHGYGRQSGHSEIYRGAEYRIDFLPKAKIELAVDDSIAEQVMEAVCNVARTGKTGDGKVWGRAHRRNRFGCHLGDIVEKSQSMDFSRGDFRPRSIPSERETRGVLGASRAGKPANSPVGAIFRRRGSFRGPMPFFYIRATGARRGSVYTIEKIDSPCCKATYSLKSAAKLCWVR